MSKAITLVTMVALLGCSEHPDTCAPLSNYDTLTATWRSGCGEPTQAEFDAILSDDGNACGVRERVDAVCEATLETECGEGEGIWEWTGTLVYDGDGYSGTLRRRAYQDGWLCAGEWRVEVR